MASIPLYNSLAMAMRNQFGSKIFSNPVEKRHVKNKLKKPWAKKYLSMDTMTLLFSLMKLTLGL